MPTTKKFLHDRLVLLIISINSFLVLLNVFGVLLRLNGTRAAGYIVSIRANLGIANYKSGKAIDLIAFVIFALMVMTVNTVLSWKMFDHHRSYSVVILSLGTLLLIMSLIISNALLVWG